MSARSCALLIALLALLPAPARARDRARLTWAPPPLHNPTHVAIHQDGQGRIDMERVTGGRGHRSIFSADGRITVKFAQDEDAEIALPDDKILKIPGLLIVGGHNIRVIGGHLQGTQAASQDLRAVLRFAGQSGSVFVEGLLIDADNQYGLDGLDVGGVRHLPGAVADIYVENCRIVGTNSTRAGFHADGFQYYGDTGWTRMDRVSVVGQYQGLFLDPQHEIRGIDLRHVDVRYSDPATGAGYIFYLRHEHNRRHPDVRLREVYAEGRTNMRPWQEFSVYPPASRADGNRYSDGRAAFPAQPEIKGYVIKGPPPGGAFVGAEDAGARYRSPGYLGEDGK
jgi:hypothetical protein